MSVSNRGLDCGEPSSRFNTIGSRCVVELLFSVAVMKSGVRDDHMMVNEYTIGESEEENFQIGCAIEDISSVRLNAVGMLS
jgi:hypothetical protein